MHIGLLHHGCERLLGHPARLQKAGEVGALAQLRDAQLDGTGAGLPIALTVAVALSQALLALLAIAGTGQALNFELHQALGGKADHLAQKIGVRALLHERAKGHHRIGHRWFLGLRWSVATRTLPEIHR